MLKSVELKVETVRVALSVRFRLDSPAVRDKW